MRKLIGCLSSVVIVLIAGLFGLRFLMMGMMGTEPDYQKLILEGQPTVQAIYEFKRQTGIWPRDLNELIPNYLPKPPGPEWQWGYPSLMRPVGRPHTGLSYNFRPPNIGWSSDGDFGTGPLPYSKPTTTRPALSSDQEFKNAMAVLDARIQREPLEFDRQRDKIIYLVHRKHTPDALGLAIGTAKAFPERWWPPMVVVELSTGDAKAVAVTAFSDWADQHPCFNNYWYLAEYHRQNNQPELAIAALEKAAAYPVVLSRPFDHYVPEWFCFDAAACACKSQKYDLALNICKQWDSVVKAQGYGGTDIPAIRAAAYLGLGRINELRSSVNMAKQAGWARDLDRLTAAAQAGNTGFIYDAEAGGSPGGGPLDLFESNGLDE